MTDKQIRAIMNAADTLSAMLGCLDENFNQEVRQTVKSIDALLKANGLKGRYS